MKRLLFNCKGYWCGNIFPKTHNLYPGTDFF